MKILGRLLKWLLLSLLGLVSLVLLFLVLDRDAQHITLSKADRESIEVQKEYVRPADSSEYYALLKTWGENKRLAPGFEMQCLLALSHYPELKKASIDFSVQPAFIPLSARPAPITVLLPWAKRRYLVVISDGTTNEDNPLLLPNADFNEQVGVIGHELAHVVFYLDKNALYLAWLAYQYETNEAFATVFEQETDKRAVAHGLGYQLYDFAFFVRKAFGKTLEEIEAEKGGMYLSPGEIAEEMKKHNYYAEPLNDPESYLKD